MLLSYDLILKTSNLINSIRVVVVGILYTIGILTRTCDEESFPLTKHVKNQFDDEASIYDASRNPWVGGYRGKGEQTLIGKYFLGNSVLELGTGTGRIMERLDSRYRYYGIDISSKMLERARDKASAEKLDVELLVMDGEHLGFRHNVFDSVIISRTLKYVENPDKALLEAKRVLRAYGRSIITCETSDKLWHRIVARGSGKLVDIRFRVGEMLRLLEREGFNVISINPIPSLFSAYYGPHKVMQVLDKMLYRIRISAWVVIGENNGISCGTTKRERPLSAERI